MLKRTTNYDSKITKAEGIFKNAQTVFSDAITTVEKSDAEFDAIILDAQSEIAKKRNEIDALQVSVDRAKAGKDMNAQFRAKINNFIEIN
ncbi:hypothetical protein CN553_12355 [Bacillus cereus]|uniref:Uncharacterized protein n=1 Tax=Bacillus cereus TaxID=1396 RepID=A0A9X6YMR5_BACCE|nr:hypothetical protein [Bacillus cereus]PEN97829.1 hypothetical protein CN553_12355 [Bacillus cereus]